MIFNEKEQKNEHTLLNSALFEKSVLLLGDINFWITSTADWMGFISFFSNFLANWANCNKYKEWFHGGWFQIMLSENLVHFEI